VKDRKEYDDHKSETTQTHIMCFFSLAERANLNLMYVIKTF